MILLTQGHTAILSSIMPSQAIQTHREVHARLSFEQFYLKGEYLYNPMPFIFQVHNLNTTVRVPMNTQLRC